MTSFFSHIFLHSFHFLSLTYSSISSGEVSYRHSAYFSSSLSWFLSPTLCSISEGGGSSEHSTSFPSSYFFTFIFSIDYTFLHLNTGSNIGECWLFIPIIFFFLSYFLSFTPSSFSIGEVSSDDSASLVFIFAGDAILGNFPFLFLCWTVLSLSYSWDDKFSPLFCTLSKFISFNLSLIISTVKTGFPSNMTRKR